MSTPTIRERAATQQERLEYRRLYYLAFPEKVAELSRRKRINNPEHYRNYLRKWMQDNKEHCKKQKHEYYLRYRDKFKLKAREYNRINKESLRIKTRMREEFRRKTDINFRIKSLLRSRLYNTTRGMIRADKTLALLGCSVNELKAHLESQFLDGMNWGNYGSGGWHIDHIIPCAVFDLSNPEHQRKCFHYTNLQPLWARDNHRKGGRLEDNQFPLIYVYSNNFDQFH